MGTGIDEACKLGQSVGVRLAKRHRGVAVRATAKSGVKIRFILHA